MPCRKLGRRSGGDVVEERQHHGVQRAVDMDEAAASIEPGFVQAFHRAPDVVVGALHRGAAG
jgi:hypothetical protein